MLPDQKQDVVTVENQLRAIGNNGELFDLCLCNSGAILWYPDTNSQAIRAGIAMYGVSPNPQIKEEELGLKPGDDPQNEGHRNTRNWAGDSVG